MAFGITSESKCLKGEGHESRSETPDPKLEVLKRQMPFFGIRPLTFPLFLEDCTWEYPWRGIPRLERLYSGDCDKCREPRQIGSGGGEDQGAKKLIMSEQCALAARPTAFWAALARAWPAGHGKGSCPCVWHL